MPGHPTQVLFTTQIDLRMRFAMLDRLGEEEGVRHIRNGRGYAKAAENANLDPGFFVYLARATLREGFPVFTSTSGKHPVDLLGSGILVLHHE